MRIGCLYHDHKHMAKERAESAASSCGAREWVAVYWCVGRFHAKRFRCSSKRDLALAKASETFRSFVRWVADVCLCNNGANWLGTGLEWSTSSGSLHGCVGASSWEIGGCCGWWNRSAWNVSPQLWLVCCSTVQIIAWECMSSGWKLLNFASAGACPLLGSLFRERLTDVRQSRRRSTRIAIVITLVAAIRRAQV